MEFNPRRSRIGLAMIVRNEAHIIERCLGSVRSLIDTWTIVDTGSTDNTIDLVSAVSGWHRRRGSQATMARFLDESQ
jgi:hypothetical protein